MRWLLHRLAGPTLYVSIAVIDSSESLVRVNRCEYTVTCRLRIKRAAVQQSRDQRSVSATRTATGNNRRPTVSSPHVIEEHKFHAESCPLNNYDDNHIFV